MLWEIIYWNKFIDFWSFNFELSLILKCVIVRNINVYVVNKSLINLFSLKDFV